MGRGELFIPSNAQMLEMLGSEKNILNQPLVEKP